MHAHMNAAIHPIIVQPAIRLRKAMPKRIISTTPVIISKPVAAPHDVELEGHGLVDRRHQLLLPLLKCAQSRSHRLKVRRES